MTAKRATLVSYPDDIHCSGCPNTYSGNRDSARRHGWRLGWNPQMSSWCPDCWGQKSKTTKIKITGVTVIQTDTLFD